MVSGKSELGGESLRLAVDKFRLEGNAGLTGYQRKLIDWSHKVDKGYAWVVLVALFIMMTATLGPYRIYGLVFAKVTEEGIYTRAQATWPVSMIFTVENLIGPLISIITYYITFRQSMFIGGLLLTIGNLGAWLSNCLWQDVLALGIVQGIGYAFIFMPFMEIVNSYFLRYRNMALGLALCGGTVSVFVWSPIAQWILEKYHWRVAYLAIGMICSLNLFMVPLLKPNPRPNLRDYLAQMSKNNNNSNGNKKMKPGNNQNEPEMDNKSMISRTNSLSRRALSYRSSVGHQTTMLITRKISINAKSGLKRQESVVSMNPFSNIAGWDAAPTESVVAVSGCEGGHQLVKQTSIFSLEPGLSELEAQAAAVISGLEAAQQQQQHQQQSQHGVGVHPAIVEGAEQQITAHMGPDRYTNGHTVDGPCTTLEHYETLSLSDMGQKLMEDNEFDSSLIWDILKKPAFHFICYSELLYFWVFSIYCLVLADLGRDRGCTKHEADQLLSFQSVGEIVGRIGLTILVDLRFLSTKNVVILILLIICTCFVAVTQVTGFISMAIITAIISAFSALLYITLNGLLVDYLGERQVTIGYGMSSCFSGLFLYFRPQAVGLFRDHLGSYDWLMISLAIGCAFGALLWLLEPLISHCLCRNRSRADQQEPDPPQYQAHMMNSSQQELADPEDQRGVSQRQRAASNMAN